ncbi:MAG: ABC transporter ATP-binding protein [Chloroflexi bacterium]|nr:ABC transporter ATP-binding protein [Chloroflexota bacterium]
MSLEIEHLTMQFGGLIAVNDVSLTVKPGEIHGLIGPNGSGKTTIFNVVSGYYKPTAGRVAFAGKNISGLPAHQITMLGFARTFQNLRLFKTMTVLDNVLVGMGHHAKTTLWQQILDPVGVQREEKALTDKAMALLDLFEIADHARERATSLPYGNQRRVEMARALATDPKVVLLDEPAAGLNETETDVLRETLLKIRDSGVTIFLVEHDMKLVKGVCDVISVLDYGKKIAEGAYATVSRDPVVIEAYLGKEEEL